MTLDPHDVERGTRLLLEHLDKLIDENPEISDIHDAFELFCLSKYSIGDATACTRTGGKNDCGIDFYSFNGANYNVAQSRFQQKIILRRILKK